MILLPSKDPSFYPVTQLCKTTTKHIRAMDVEKRKLASNVWHVHESCLPELFAKAKATGFHSVLDYACAPVSLKFKIDAVLKVKKASIMVSNTSDPYSTLHLLPSAPDSIVKAVYKALVLLHHPDQGGSTEDLLKVQSAYKSIQQSSDDDS